MSLPRHNPGLRTTACSCVQRWDEPYGSYEPRRHDELPIQEHEERVLEQGHLEGESDAERLRQSLLDQLRHEPDFAQIAVEVATEYRVTLSGAAASEEQRAEVQHLVERTLGESSGESALTNRIQITPRT